MRTTKTSVSPSLSEGQFIIEAVSRILVPSTSLEPDGYGPIIQDCRKRLLIPGASLKGQLRHAVQTARLCSQAMEDLLFGTSSTVGALIIGDAQLQGTTHLAVFQTSVPNGDEQRGSVYYQLCAPAGSIFTGSVYLRAWEDDETEEDLVPLVQTAFEAISHVGRRSSLGFGMVNARITSPFQSV